MKLFLTCISWLVLGVCAAAVDFYVDAVHGSDANNGSHTSPFLTISRAQQAARATPKTAPVNVFLAGTFRLPATLTFTSADSGTSASPVTYAPAPGQSATVSGGVTIAGFKPSSTVKGAFEAQVPSSVHSFGQLWVNDARYVLAKTNTMQYESLSPHGFVYAPGQLPALPANASTVQVVMYEYWTASTHEVSGINTSTRTVSLKNPFNAHWDGPATGKRFYFQNIPSALDTPGEFYFDAATGLLTVMPLPGVNMITAAVVAPQLLELVVSTGNSTSTVEYIYWKNVTFAHSAVETESCFSGTCDGQSAAFLERAAIRLEGASNWVLDGVTVAHTGGYGVWFNKASSYNTLSASHLYDLGSGGVRLGPAMGGVVAADSLNVGSVVADNLLEDGGHIYQEGCGVLASAVAKATITHNTIHHFNYTGVSIGWTWVYGDTSVADLDVSYNDIAYIGQGVLSDMGCIYSLGHQPGTVVNNNMCSHVTSFNYGGWGLYTDQASRDLTYSNNIVFATNCAGIHQHFGLNNTFVNNILSGVDTGSLGMGTVRSSRHPGTCTQPASGADGACSGFHLDTNVFVGTKDSMLYATQADGFDNVTFARNTYWTTSGNPASLPFPHGMNFTQWLASGRDKGSGVDDPLFVDAAAANFTLEPSSPALARGFKQVDTAGIGPRRAVGVDGRIAPRTQVPSELVPFTKQ